MKNLFLENPDHPIDRATAAWIAVVRAYNECTATLAQRLAPLGISLLEHEILMNLLRAPGLTQRELSERCFSAKSGISMLVSRLEKEGFVARARSETDKRALSLALTKQGKRRARQAMEVQTQVVMAMATAYSGEELALLEGRMDQSSVLLQQMRQDPAS